MECKKQSALAQGLEWPPKKGKKGKSKPAAAPAPPKAPTSAGGDDAKAEILARHNAQGATVGGLKKSKAPKAEVDAAVAVLLAIKKEYKELTGDEVPRPDNGKGKKGKEQKVSPQQPQKEAKQ
jgi:bifunctional glutamyl/prolyl-tRNA synthetase